jgi:hypothetical protein
MRDLKFQMHCWSEEARNFNWLKYRGFQGHLAAGKNSGSHWVKYMLSLALADHHGLERPDFLDVESAAVFIANPRIQRNIRGLPRLMSSHTIPGFGYDFGPLRPGTSPPVVVLVRDLRHVLVSHYERWKNRMGLSWSQYLRLPFDQEKARCDIWWYIHFLNRWGDCAKRLPHEITSLHYEDLRKNTAPNIECILRHFDLHVPSATVRRAIETAPQYVREGKTDPDAPDRIVSQQETTIEPYFSGEDGEYFRKVVAKNLRHTFGYNYTAPMSARPMSTVRNRVARSPIA